MRSTAVAAPIVFLAVVLASCGGPTLVEKTVTFQEKGTNNFAFVDNPPKSTTKPSAEPELSNGDQIAFSSDYVDSSGRKIGRLDATCFITQGRPGNQTSYSSCHGTATLPRGQLFLSVGGKLPSRTTNGAVTGGTGDYAGATGTFTAVGESNAKDTFHLFMPHG
jgi:hypothetical protein